MSRRSNREHRARRRSARADRLDEAGGAVLVASETSYVETMRLPMPDLVVSHLRAPAMSARSRATPWWGERRRPAPSRPEPPPAFVPLPPRPEWEAEFREFQGEAIHVTYTAGSGVWREVWRDGRHTVDEEQADGTWLRTVDE